MRLLLSELIKYYLTSSIVLEEKENQSLLQQREEKLEHYLLSFPRNQEDHNRLLECGYHKDLWIEVLSVYPVVFHTSLAVFPTQGVSVAVKTDGARSLEENMRQALLACYQEYVELLNQLKITHVSVYICHYSSASVYELGNLGKLLLIPSSSFKGWSNFIAFSVQI